MCQGVSDEELVLRSRAGDLASFDNLARRHRDRLFALAYVIVREAETAADVVQEALLTAWRALDQLRDPAQVGVWLTVITRRLALRQQARRRGQSAALDPWVEDVEARAEWERAAHDDAELRAIVRRAVADLPPNLRDPIVLHHFHGLSYAEVCRRLEISLPAVRTRLLRAHNQLEESLADALGLPVPHISMPRRPTMPMLPFEEPKWEIRPLDTPDFAVHVQENSYVPFQDGTVGEYAFMSWLNRDWESPDWNANSRRIPWHWRHEQVRQAELDGEPGWEVREQIAKYDGTIYYEARRYFLLTDEAFVLRTDLNWEQDAVTKVSSSCEHDSGPIWRWPRRLKVNEISPGVPPYQAYFCPREVELCVGNHRERCIEALYPAEPRDLDRLPGTIRVWYFSEDGRERLQLAYGKVTEPECADARPAPRLQRFGNEWYLRWVFVAADLMPNRPDISFL